MDKLLVQGWSSGRWRSTATRRKLYKIDEVAEYQRSNPFILSGYRGGDLTVFDCVRSVFHVHNETVNIWTHLLGFFVFCALLIRDLLVIPYDLVSFSDLLVLTCMMACYQACMLLSSLFHTLTCHSKSMSERCLSLDLAGITLALLATYLSGIYYAFWCQPGWRDFYLLTVGGIFALAAAAQFHPKFAVEGYAHLRITLFTVWAVYGLVPTVHWVVLHNGDFSAWLVPVMLPRIVIMYTLCGVAFVFYVFKLPERLVPGHVDIVGHSHQWWHVFIFVALCFWHRTGVTFALFRLANDTCDHLPQEDVLRGLSLWPF